MMGPTHRLFGAVCGAAYAAAQHATPTMCVMTGIVAGVTANGPASPDMDQTELWRRTVGKLPHRLGGAWTGHRKITHWWGWPLIAWLILIPGLTPNMIWPATTLLIGWVSHLIGDLIFGELPLLPWGGRTVGLGVDTDGFIESGRLNLFGKERPVIPFGPTRVLLMVLFVQIVTRAGQ